MKPKSIVAVSVLAGIVMSTLPAGAQEVTLRVSGHWPDGHAASIGAEILASELDRLTGGAVKFDYYPNSALGGVFEGVDQVRAGLNDIDMGGPEWYSRVIPEVDLINLPFFAAGARQAYCIADGPVGDLIAEKALERGLVVLGWMTNGGRHTTNNIRPIASLEDLEGLSIRTPPSEIYQDTFRLMGASATPIDITELYQALQQGVVDGQENPYDNILQRNFYEVQRYLSNTGHFFSYAWILMNKGSHDRLSDEHRDALHEATFRAVGAQRRLADRANEAALAALIERGMVYTELTPEQLGEFRERTLPLYDGLRSKIGDEAVDLLLDAIDSCA